MSTTITFTMTGEHRKHLSISTTFFTTTTTTTATTTSVWRCSAVDIATCCELGSSGFESLRGRNFPYTSRPVLGISPPTVQWIPGLFPGGKAAGTWRWPSTPIYGPRCSMGKATALFLLCASGGMLRRDVYPSSPSQTQYNSLNHHHYHRRSPRTNGRSRQSAAARLPGLRVRIPPEHVCLLWVLCVGR